MSRAIPLNADTLGKVRRFLREDFRNWLAQADKKPLMQQAGEMAELWRAYHFFPYQYFKHDLYMRGVGAEYRDFFPSVLADNCILEINPKAYAPLLEDKVQFDKRMEVAGLPMVETFAILTLEPDGLSARRKGGGALTFAEFVTLARQRGERSIFIKPRFGGQGVGAHRFEVGEVGLERDGAPVTEESLKAFLLPHGFDDYLVQPYFEQHETFRAINPGSVNTLRVVTFLDGDDFEIVGTALRVGRGVNDTDNWSAGGFIANVDLDQGSVAEVARTKLAYSPQRNATHHPISNIAFGDVRIPHAHAVRDLVERGARAFAPIRLIGWDIAMSADGPRVLEGNFLSAFVMLQDACGGLRQTAYGRELARMFNWR